MTHRRSLIFASFALAALLQLRPAAAADRTFTIGGDGKNSNITFESETDFETILGHTNTASGTVIADLEAGTGSVDVRVPVATLDTGIELRNKHLQSGDWLDAKKAPELRFVSRSARKLDDGSWEIAGDFTLHGVSAPLTVHAQVKPIPAEAAKAAGLGKGDWLRVSAPFDVKLSTHGVEVPSKVAGRVSDTWKVKLNLFVNAKGGARTGGDPPMTTRVLSHLARWARRGALTGLMLALVIPLAAFLVDRRWGREVLLIAPHDPSVVALNRSIWTAGEPVPDLYGSPMSEPTRVLLFSRRDLVRPAEDPSLSLLPANPEGRRPLQTQTVWWAVRLVVAALGAIVAALFGLNLFVRHREKLAAPVAVTRET